MILLPGTAAGEDWWYGRARPPGTSTARFRLTPIGNAQPSAVQNSLGSIIVGPREVTETVRVAVHRLSGQDQVIWPGWFRRPDALAGAPLVRVLLVRDACSVSGLTVLASLSRGEGLRHGTPDLLGIDR
jgi:hypothetical protein